MDPHRDDDIREKVRAVYEKAIDAALDAEPDDIRAIDVGLRAAQYLVNDRLVEPPHFSAYADEPSDLDEVSPSSMRIDRIALEVGPDLARRADPDDIDGDLLERLRHVRRRVAQAFGVIAPGVRVRPNDTLEQGEYRILIRGEVVAEGAVRLTHSLGVGEDLGVPGVAGEPTVDPIYGCPAIWMPNEDADRARDAGLKVFDSEDVVTSHVAETVKAHLGELLDREEVAGLLTIARQETPMVVQELVPNMLSLGQLRQVLQNLVRERVPIKDMSTILNALADNAVYTKDPHALTERVRVALARTICARLVSADGSLKVYRLSPDAERAIQNSIQLNESGQVLMLDPATSTAIRQNLDAAIEPYRSMVLDPIVLAPPKIRRHVKALLERTFPKLVVLSHDEVVAGVRVETLRTIEAASAVVNPPVLASGGDWLLGDEDD